MEDEIFENVLKHIFIRTTDLTIHDESDLKNYNGGLFHYTNSDGLLGILQSQKIWATESIFLNDSTEIQHGIQLTENLINERSISSNCDTEESILNKIKDKLYKNIHETYIACFSENGDLLSQWKGYGNYGSGYSIELDPKQLFRQKRKYPHVKIDVVKVIYDIEKQIDSIKSELDFAISYTKKWIQKYPDAEDGITKVVTSNSAYILCYNALRFKQQAFEEEKEWRAFYRNSSSNEEGYQPPRFRVSNDTIIPYLEFDLSPSAGKKVWSLPIKKIIIGSKINYLRALKSIEMLSQLKNMDNFSVEKSKIPLQ